MALRDEKSRSTCGKDFIVEGEEVCVRENINVVNQNRLIVGEEACSLLESTTRFEELVGFVAETDVDAETVVGLDEINDLLSEMMNIDDNLCDTNTLQFLDKYLLPQMGTIALGMVSVRGLRRVPRPAAKISAFIILT